MVPNGVQWCPCQPEAIVSILSVKEDQTKIVFTLQEKVKNSYSDFNLRKELKASLKSWWKYRVAIRLM
jgi:hypothetical protein